MVPGVGPLLVAGPFVAALVGALESAAVVGGFSALGAALVSIGIPNNSIVQYEGCIKSGQFLMVAHGTPEEVERAKELLSTSGATKTELFLVDEPVAVVAIHDIVAAKPDSPMPEADQVLHDVLGGISGATTREADVRFIVAVGDHGDVHAVFRDVDRHMVRLVINPENEAVDSAAREE